MRTIRIYQNQPLITNAEITLDIPASHHLVNVLRAKGSDKIILFNGDGHNYIGEIITKQKKVITVLIKNKLKINNESHLEIHLYQALIKSDRMDYAIQKAVELGVTSITPLITKHCDLKINPNKITNKLEHWQKVIIAACEQSGRCVVPKLNTLINLNEIQPSACNIVLSPTGKKTLQQCKITSPVTLFIGPEGGIAEEELTYLQSQDFNLIKYGPRILRAETATVAAISSLQLLTGDLS